MTGLNPEKFIPFVGEKNVLRGDDVAMRSVTWGKDDPCLAKAIVRPADTNEVSEIVRICNRAGQKLIMHGGRTGLVDALAAQPDDIVVSLERMRTVDEVNRLNRTVAVEAGATIESIQTIADDAGFMFASDFGARGSATLGGAIATNAGGLNVIRFGAMREQILGLEVVLPSGDILSMMNGVIKNNTGYDLKQLFIGSEGTLGIVTKAVLRLRHKAPRVHTAFLGLNSFESAVGLLHKLENVFAGTVTAFEVMWPEFYKRVTMASDLGRAPFTREHPIFVLLELQSPDNPEAQEGFLSTLGDELEAGRVEDAVIANSEAERKNLWAFRENIEALMEKRVYANFDFSLEINDIPAAVDAVQNDLMRAYEGAEVMPFGHLGDNNLHLCLNLPDEMSDQIDSAKSAVYASLLPFGACISAEHGIGREKKKFLSHSRSHSEVELMRSMKQMFDPNNILNPDLIF